MGAWSTTTALTTAVYYNMCVGSHDDCLSIGAAVPSGAVNKFNSSTWATTNALNTARYQIFAAGCGGNALAYGGYTGSYVCYTTVEKFTGSTWTTTTSLLSSRGFGGSLAGSNPHAGTMAVCGLQNGTGNPQTTNEYWNGSIWAITSLLNTMRTGSYCAGNMNGGMCCGSGITVEKWTGSAWATTNALGLSRFQHGVAGTSTNWVLVYGGYTGATVYTLESELWNGSAWSTVASFGTGKGRYGFGFCGVGKGALCAGGYTGATTTDVVRYRSEGESAFRVWSLTSNLNTPRFFHISFGNATDAIAATGAPGPIGTGERWSGSAWATTGSVNSPCYQAAAFGDASAGILAGGYYTSTLTRTEIWSGTAWSTTSAVLSVGTYSAAGIGSTTAGLYIGGYGPSATVYKWNSSAWVTFTALPVTRFYGGACGITSAVLVPGGYEAGVSAVTYIFLGSSWATTTVLNTARERHAVCGSTSSAIVSGGSTLGGTPSNPSWSALDSCEHWDGTIWSMKSALNVGRLAHTHVGSETVGLVAGGTDGALTFPFTEISSNASVDSTYFTLSGEVDVSSVPTGNRTVRLYNRDTGNQFGSVLSGVGGTFSFTVPDGTTRYFALAFPSTGESYNAAVADNVQPKPHTATWMYSGAWSTTNGFLVPRQQGFVAGVTSKAIVVSGYTGATVPTTSCETWSGSSWSSTSSVSGARYGHSLFGSGTRTMMISGYNAGNLLTCEYYGGTSWASTTAVTVNRTYAGYVGSIGAGLLCGGVDGSSNAPLDYTTKWDGSTWTNTCTMLHPQSLVAVFGNTSVAIASAGRRANLNTDMYYQGEKWDGTVWSDTSSHIYGGYVFSACGSTNRGLCGGMVIRGLAIKTASIWNGSSWSTTTDQNQILVSTLCGYCDAALLSGNYGLTEIFRQGLSLSGVGTWATTGSINAGRQWGASAGNTGSALFFTGYTAGGINNNEYWAGSSWSTTVAHTVAMWASLGLGGSSSAVLSVGGVTGASIPINLCHVWNASSWATTTVFPVNKYGIAGIGDTSSALLCKGYTTANTASTYNWLSSSWSTTTSSNISAYGSTMWGITSSAMVAGGLFIDAVEKWDGSSWSMTTNLLTPVLGAASAGTTSSAIIYGGNISDTGSIKAVNNTFRWTGTAWTVTTNMITARATHRGVGSMSNALAFGGYTSEDTTYPLSCEIWSYA